MNSDEKWDELYTMQEDLDHYIETNHNLKNTALKKDKILALLVELGELANETRCFKFWSTKQPGTRDAIQEEYVDGIHFLMSIGLDYGYRYQLNHIPVPTVDKTTQFNNVFAACTTFADDPTSAYYQALFVEFLALGKLLNITQTDIYNAYMAKNKKNYTRQKQGY